MLSIIIPALNEEDYLPALLKSIRRQDFNDYEIIVADGGSEDETIKIAKDFGCIIAPGGSTAKGRNEGAKIAKGDLFLFIDADSVLSEHLLLKLITEFNKRKLGLASFPVYPQGNIIDKICYGVYNLWTKITQNFLPHATQTVLIKKEIHQKISGFDEKIKIGEDHAYARNGAKSGKFGFISCPPLLTSTRRFDREGRLKTYLTYILSGIYMFFLGGIKSDIFKYRYPHLPKIKKREDIKKS